MRPLLLVCLAALAPQVAVSQQAEKPNRTPTPGTTALTIGYLDVDVEYIADDNEFAYVYSGPATAVMLSSEKAQFTVTVRRG